MKPLAIVVAAVATLSPVTALGSELTVKSKTVTYLPSELRTEAGVAGLYGRLENAAKDVCGTPGRTLEDRAAVRECRKVAVDEAVRTSNLSELYYHHAARTGAGRVLVGAKN